MTNEEIKDKLLVAGIKNLKDFGYSDVTKETILTDTVYSQFFLSMLNDNLYKSTKQIDEVINELIKEIKK